MKTNWENIREDPSALGWHVRNSNLIIHFLFSLLCSTLSTNTPGDSCSKSQFCIMKRVESKFFVGRGSHKVDFKNATDLLNYYYFQVLNISPFPFPPHFYPPCPFSLSLWNIRRNKEKRKILKSRKSSLKVFFAAVSVSLNFQLSNNCQISWRAGKYKGIELQG